MSSNISALVRRLSQHAALSDDDLADIALLPRTTRNLPANAFIVHEGDAARSCCSLVVSGMAFRHKLTAEGARQIVSLHFPGDVIDLQQSFLNIADHSLQALTELEVTDIDRASFLEVVLKHPSVAYALLREGLIDASICREWVLNVGRRDARAKIAHLLCELCIRMQATGVIASSEFRLPLTQEQFADATGLTGVHVNRTFRSLDADGFIKHRGRQVLIVDWEGLCSVGDFDPLYLHLDQLPIQAM